MDQNIARARNMLITYTELEQQAQNVAKTGDFATAGKLHTSAKSALRQAERCILDEPGQTRTPQERLALITRLLAEVRAA